MVTKLLNWVVALLVVSAVVLSGSNCLADTAAEARKIAEAHKDAVVNVVLVLETEMSYEGKAEKEERKLSATATVIDPSGLAVASLSEIDPGTSEEMAEAMPEGGPKFSYSSRVVDAKIKKADGSEVAAEVVLRDRDLDLAFIRPKTKPEEPAVFIDLSKPGTPQALDEVLILSRLGQAAGRSPAASVERVQAVVTKPRTFYVIAGLLGQGCPAFTLGGKTIGVVVVRSLPGPARGSDWSPTDADMTIILPCATIAKAAEQAKGAAAPAEGK